MNSIGNSNSSIGSSGVNSPGSVNGSKAISENDANRFKDLILKNHTFGDSSGDSFKIPSACDEVMCDEEEKLRRGIFQIIQETLAMMSNGA